MKAFLIMALLLTSCAGWYETSRRTIDATYTTVSLGWGQASAELGQRMIEAAERCAEMDVSFEKCIEVKAWEGLQRDIGTSVKLVSKLAQDALCAVDAVGGRASLGPPCGGVSAEGSKQSRELRAKQIIEALLRAAGHVLDAIKEHKLWTSQKF